MLDRVVSDKKEKVQFYLKPETVKTIFDRAASFSPRKTQSKFITDLVEAAEVVHTLDLVGLGKQIRVIAASPMMDDDDARHLALRIASEFFGVQGVKA